MLTYEDLERGRDRELDRERDRDRGFDFECFRDRDRDRDFDFECFRRPDLERCRSLLLRRFLRSSSSSAAAGARWALCRSLFGAEPGLCGNIPSTSSPCNNFISSPDGRSALLRRSSISFKSCAMVALRFAILSTSRSCARLSRLYFVTKFTISWCTLALLTKQPFSSCVIKTPTSHLRCASFSRKLWMSSKKVSGRRSNIK